MPTNPVMDREHELQSTGNNRLRALDAARGQAVVRDKVMTDDDQVARRSLFDKYSKVSGRVDRLEPSVITMMYKEFKGPSTYYPNIGLFFNEFALVYAAVMKPSKP